MLDYAYWNPLSLVIKDQGWLEEELAADGYTVEWVLSAGSSKAIENLNAEAINIGSSAGAAALSARANGVALTTVGVFICGGGGGGGGGSLTRTSKRV